MEAGYVGFPFVPPMDPVNVQPHFYLAHPPPHNLNPIDRLYSMQATYFCGDDAPMDQ